MLPLEKEEYMIIKLFSRDSKVLVPYFEPGITETGRRYVTLITNDGRKKRQYIDPYRKRTKKELEN